MSMSMSSAEVPDMVFSEIEGNTAYGRINHQLNIKYIDQMTALHKCKYGFLAPSGMSAIAILFHGILTDARSKKNRVNITFSNELFGPSKKLITSSLKELYDNINCYSIDVKTCTIHDIKYVIGEVNILYIESATNPNGIIFDYSLLASLPSDMIVIVDNTWFTHDTFNPFSFRVDFVILSLTKYYSAGKAIGGLILGNNDMYRDNIAHWIKLNGIHVSPYNVSIFIDALDTLAERMDLSGKLTRNVIGLLNEHKTMTRQYEIQHHTIGQSDRQKYIVENGFASVFTITMRTMQKKENVISILNLSHLFPCRASFGEKISKIDSSPKLNKKELVIRISIGYEGNAEEIVAELVRLIDSFI